MAEALYGRPPYTSPPDSRAVSGSGNILLQVIILPKGKWLLLGRAKLQNYDGDGQGHSLHLRADNAAGGLLDWVDNYTGGDTSENMKVQGFIDITQSSGAVVMTYAGYKAQGGGASLIAVKLDDFGPGRADVKVPPTGIPPERPQHPQ